MADEPAKERQEIDPVFKQVVEAEFTAYQAACQTEYEVNRLPRKIDAFVTVDDETALQKIRQETPLFYLLRHSQLEFKGRRDWLTKVGCEPSGFNPRYSRSYGVFVPRQADFAP